MHLYTYICTYIIYIYLYKNTNLLNMPYRDINQIIIK